MTKSLNKENVKERSTDKICHNYYFVIVCLGYGGANLFSRSLYFVTIGSSHTILKFAKILLICSIASSPTILKFANIPLIYNHILFFFNVFKLNLDIRDPQKNLFTKAPFNYSTPILTTRYTVFVPLNARPDPFA